MLKELSLDQARGIAALAKTVRVERDELLGNVAEADIETEHPGRGEHNPTASLGFDPLPADAPQILTLRQAIGALSKAARRELYALMRIGQGHLAVKDWERGISEAVQLGDETVAAEFIEDADLHDHIAKGLYEAGLST
jgi:hypothetical protein